MSHPQNRMDLLHTKLHPPPLREKRVVRMRLMHKLDAALNHKLTLICAPAGYGKTTLLRHWINRRDHPVGWLSIDSRDNDITQFLHYFLATLQQIDPDIGTLIPEMLQPPQPLSGSAVWIALINDLAASDKEFVIILDDYQEVQDQAVHDVLEYLIDHMPDNLHLLLATRADPPINLPLLRARDQLLEFRTADLCFNNDDARSFLQDVMGLRLSERDIVALVQKAEGWIAGLQIAAIVIQNQTNLPQAVQTFTGSHRHILDYLAIEVIEHLPGTIKDFLCQTAILDNLDASLCDAVTGRKDSLQILERLDRENQFVVPLDENRRWFRYHRLMAEALKRWTERLDSGHLTALHRRASTWYEAQGMIEPAIEHAFKSSDIERVAGLIEAGAEAILKRSQVITLLNWLNRLPDELFVERPRLNIAYAWALLLKGGSIQVVQARLEASIAHSADRLVSAEEAVIHALIATYTGDVHQGFAYARRALDDLPADRIFLRSIAAGNLGMVYVVLGDIEAAIQAFKESIALARDSGNIMFAVASLSNLGGLYLLQGHLQLAAAVYRQALELATTQYGWRLPVACRALMGLGEIAREWNDLEQARQLLEEAIQLARQYNQTGELMMYLSLARVFQAQGDGVQALDLVQQAQSIAIQSTGSTIDDRVADAALARLWLQQGNITGAAKWAARRGFEQVVPNKVLPGDDTITIPYDLHETEWLLYARLQLAQNRASAALDTLAVLFEEVQKQGRGRHLNEILVLMALAFQSTGAIEPAMESIQKSLKQAELDGYTRIYIDEGPPMLKLLREAIRRGVQNQSCNRLLSAFQSEERRTRVSAGDPVGLVEPLSEREVEVLQLLAEGCPNREIGQRLYISLSTVKGHTSNIYGKLLVKNRTEAVARARQLGILPGD